MTTEQRKEVSEIDELLEILLSAKDDGNGNIQERVEARQAIQELLVKTKLETVDTLLSKVVRRGGDYLETELKVQELTKMRIELQQSLKPSKERQSDDKQG